MVKLLVGAIEQQLRLLNDLPHANGTITGTARDTSLFTQCVNAHDFVLMSEERFNVDELIDVPHLDTAVEWGRIELVGVLLEYNAWHGVSMTLERVDKLACIRVPDFYWLVLSTRG